MPFSDGLVPVCLANLLKGATGEAELRGGAGGQGGKEEVGGAGERARRAANRTAVQSTRSRDSFWRQARAVH